MKQILAILLFLFLPLAKVYSAPIISGISKNEIKIDSKFTGEKILLFGAKNEPGNIIAVVRGPKHNFLLNKKSTTSQLPDSLAKCNADFPFLIEN